MMVSPSSGRPRSKAGLSSLQAFPEQTSHPAGVDPNHCPAFGTGELQENGTTRVNGAVAPCRTTATFPRIGGLLRVRSADRTSEPILACWFMSASVRKRQTSCGAAKDATCQQETITSDRIDLDQSIVTGVS